MLLHEFYQGVELHRLDKIIYAKFIKPHRVISTCRAAGGIRDGLDYVFNHQSCEPSGHMDALPESAWKDPLKYRDMVAGRYGLPPDGCATLGTAANMHNAAVAQESFRKHRVAAVSTGGVECNAGRVGEPASGYEEDGEHQRLDRQETPRAGTINTMLFIGQELTHGALVRSIVTATEAKAAALQELNVNSRYSPGLATGTGTDQIAVACLLGGVPLSGAGKHSKLGELIGQAVKKSVMVALALQNKLTPGQAVFGPDSSGALRRGQEKLPDQDSGQPQPPHGRVAGRQLRGNRPRSSHRGGGGGAGPSLGQAGLGRFARRVPFGDNGLLRRPAGGGGERKI